MEAGGYKSMYYSLCVTEGQNQSNFGNIPQLIKTRLDYFLYMLLPAQFTVQDNIQGKFDLTYFTEKMEFIRVNIMTCTVFTEQTFHPGFPY